MPAFSWVPGKCVRGEASPWLIPQATRRERFNSQKCAANQSAYALDATDVVLAAVDIHCERLFSRAVLAASHFANAVRDTA